VIGIAVTCHGLSAVFAGKIFGSALKFPRHAYHSRASIGFG
jgi:hypothetical protein